MTNLSWLNRRKSCNAISASMSILQGLDTDLALSCLGDLLNGRYREYLGRTVDASQYDDWRAFYRDYISVNLLSKFPNFDLDIDREKVALDKFLLSEQSCKDANLRLASLYRGGIPFSSPLVPVFHSARLKIERLLGDFSWDEAEQGFGFGPGACIGLGHRNGDSWYKFGVKTPSTTRANAALAECALKRSPTWLRYVSDNFGKEASDCLKIVEGNRITTVPKSAKTNRVIAIEPQMNMFIQKGIGSVIRRRLKRVKVNLDSQEHNQLLAKAGSQDGSLATIDLASASDSISLALVELLLPEDWVTAIKLCRSPVGTLPDGTLLRYQKVSSMGNGYTFELQSLIFWALSTSVMSYLKDLDRRFAIYGDDIIVPTGCVDVLIGVLEYAGFKTNVEKSFWSGPFRESCGKHYFSGHDVTPFYIREGVDSNERLLWLANSIKRLAHRLSGYGYGCESDLQASYNEVVALLPRPLRKPTIPFNFGDGALAGDLDEVCPRRHRYFDAYIVRTLSRRYSSFRGCDEPMLLKSLQALEKKPGSFLALPLLLGPFGEPGVDLCKIPLQRYKLAFVKGLASQWEGLGPWL